MAVFGWFADAAFDASFVLVPLTPPHAASSAPALEKVRPAAPRRAMTCRRERRPSTSSSKNRSSERSGSGMHLSLGDEDGMGGVPGEQHLATRAERVGSLAETVLLHGGELLAARGVHHVLDRGAEEAGD